MHVSSLLNDSLRSLVTGLGGERDKGSSGRFAMRSRLSSSEIQSLWQHSFLGGKAVDLPAEDMTSNWRTFQGRSSDVAAIEAEEQRLDLQAKVCLALKLSARDGGALVIIGTGTDPSFPLDPASVGKGGLQYLHVLSRARVSIGSLEIDPASPWAGQPREYRIFVDDGRQLAIHPSRVALFVVGPKLDSFETGEPWGLSVYERMHDPIRDLTQTLMSIQHLIAESKQDVIQIEGLNQGVRDPGYQSALIARFSLAQQMKGLLSALILDKAETWEARQLSLVGFPEVVDRLFMTVCGAFDIPASRLFGREPGGINSASASTSELERYYSMLASRQRTIMTPALRTLDECLIRSALGRRPKKLFFEWLPLWNMAATDLAEIRLKHSQAAKNLADAGLIDPVALGRAVVSQAEDDGWLPALAQHVAEAAAAPTSAAARTSDAKTDSPMMED